MTAADIIGATTITQVWVAQGGDPPKHGRARAFFRNGDNPQAVSLNDAKGCWYDHRDGVGGGVLDLIQHVLGCDRRLALRWLADFTGLPLEDRPLTPMARREDARRRAQVQQLAREVGDFERGLELFLQRRQKNAAAVTSWLLSIGVDDPGEMLAGATSDLAILRKVVADSLVQTYRELPEAVRRPFRDAGRRDREHAERITRAVVGMLAQIAERQPAGSSA